MTPQQEKFAQNVAKGMNKTEAAKAAGYSEKNATRAGSMLASNSNPKVMDRITQLQEMGALKAGLNLSTHLVDLKDIRDGAMRNGAWSAAVTAEVEDETQSTLGTQQSQNQSR